jgi:DNA-binding MarR family transcriptional regulator
MTAYFDARLKSLGFAVSYIELLITLDEQGKCSQKTLSEQLFLAPSTITRFLQKLEKEGLLTRERNGYSSMVTLTEEGKNVAKKGKKIYQEAWEEVLNQVGDKFTETTGKLLQYGSAELQKLEQKKP